MSFIEIFITLIALMCSCFIGHRRGVNDMADATDKIIEDVFSRGKK